MKSVTTAMLGAVAFSAFAASEIHAQVAINGSGVQSDSSAMLDLTATNRGLLLPRMADTQRDAILSPATGLTAFITTDSRFQYFNGSAWTLLGSDNLGNHTLTQNLSTNGLWISRDGANDGLFLDSSNNVGIGTSTPAGKLHVFSVSDSIVTLESNTNSTILVSGSAPNGESCLQFRTGGSDNWLVGLDDLPSGNTKDFAIKNINNSNPAFLVHSTTGRVGIGSGNPLQTLEVNGALRIGSTISSTPGTLRWTGDEFEGGDGQQWKPLGDAEVSVIHGGIPAAGGTPVPDASQDSGNTTGGYDARDEKWQSFTPEHSGRLAQIEIHHGTIPNFLADGYLRIYAGEGTDGLVLHEQAVNDGNTNGSWATYVMTGTVEVKAGARYTLQFFDLDDDYDLQLHDGNPYAGGIFDGDPTRDLQFKTQVVPSIDVLAVNRSTGDLSFLGSSLVIREDGNVGMNTASPASKLHVRDNFASYSQFVATIENTGNASGSGGLLVQCGQNSSPGNTRFIQFNRPDGTQIGNIRQDAANSVFYATTSDERLKTLIGLTSFGLGDLMGIDVRDYVFEDDPERPQTGFIAQQLHEHYPPAVAVGGEDEKTDPWQVDYSKLTPLLVKAVQELRRTADAQTRYLQAQEREIERLETEKASAHSRLKNIEEAIERTLP